MIPNMKENCSTLWLMSRSLAATKYIPGHEICSNNPRPRRFPVSSPPPGSLFLHWLQLGVEMKMHFSERFHFRIRPVHSSLFSRREGSSYWGLGALHTMCAVFSPLVSRAVPQSHHGRTDGPSVKCCIPSSDTALNA